jgi:flavin-dependent dehydrogenase
LIDGQPHVNVGVYSLGDAKLPNATLQHFLVQEITALQRQGSESFHSALSTPPSALPGLKFRAFPIYGYAPKRRLAAPHVVLVGDAAGAEPLMGEGISFALEYGKYAARQILTALTTHCFDFHNYTTDFAVSHAGKKLTRLYYAAQLFYGRTAPLWFTLAACSRRLQSVGLKWYNGVEGWHQRSGWEAVWTVLRPQMKEV